MSLQHLRDKLHFLYFLPYSFFLHATELIPRRPWVAEFKRNMNILQFFCRTACSDHRNSSGQVIILVRLTSPSRLCKASSRTIEMHCWEKHDYFAILWPYLQWWHIFLVSVCVLLSEGFSSEFFSSGMRNCLPIMWMWGCDADIIRRVRHATEGCGDAYCS